MTLPECIEWLYECGATVIFKPYDERHGGARSLVILLPGRPAFKTAYNFTSGVQALVKREAEYQKQIEELGL